MKKHYDAYEAPSLEAVDAIAEEILCTSPEGSTEQFEESGDYEW